MVMVGYMVVEEPLEIVQRTVLVLDALGGGRAASRHSRNGRRFIGVHTLASRLVI